MFFTGMKEDRTAARTKRSQFIGPWYQTEGTTMPGQGEMTITKWSDAPYRIIQNNQNRLSHEPNPQLSSSLYT
jgi:hypothetical protein